MSKKAKEDNILKNGLSLFAVTALFVLLLTGAHLATRGAIQAQFDAARTAALSNVMPSAVDGHFADPVISDSSSSVVSYSIAYVGNQPVGVVFEISVSGWNPGLIYLLGVDLEGEVTGIEILTHQETPIISDPIEEPEFLDQFIGRTAGIVHVPGGQNATGNQVALITGVTISARVMVEGANDALDYFHHTVMPIIAEQYGVEAPEAPAHAGEQQAEADARLQEAYAAARQVIIAETMNDALLELAGAAFSNTVYTSNDVGIISYTVAMLGGQPIGAFIEMSVVGWNPYIVFLVGVDLNGEIMDFRIISHRETIGFGDVIEAPAFQRQ